MKPERKKIPLYLAAMLGVLVGLGAFLTIKSNAVSYLSDDSSACVNCHVMGSYYAGYVHGSHGHATTCNDCHVPHTSLLAKYAFKARDGLYHASVFTLRAEPQSMMIKDAGANVVQANCVRCHGGIIETVLPVNATRASARHGEGRLCWDCHREIPHGSAQSISSAPTVTVPFPTGAGPAPMPGWLRAAADQYKTLYKE